MIIGGQTNGEQYQSAIHYLPSVRENWTTLKQKLKIKRSNFVAFFVPDSLATCTAQNRANAYSCGAKYFSKHFYVTKIFQSTTLNVTIDQNSKFFTLKVFAKMLSTSGLIKQMKHDYVQNHLGYYHSCNILQTILYICNFLCFLVSILISRKNIQTSDIKNNVVLLKQNIVFVMTSFL